MILFLTAKRLILSDRKAAAEACVLATSFPIFLTVISGVFMSHIVRQRESGKGKIDLSRHHNINWWLTRINSLRKYICFVKSAFFSVNSTFFDTQTICDNEMVHDVDFKWDLSRTSFAVDYNKICKKSEISLLNSLYFAGGSISLICGKHKFMTNCFKQRVAQKLWNQRCGLLQPHY